MTTKKKLTTNRPSLVRDLSTRKSAKSSKLLTNSKNTKVTVNEILNPTIFEPKVTNRWICYIEDSNGTQVVPTYLIKGFKRPNIEAVMAHTSTAKGHYPPDIVTKQQITPPLAPRRVISTSEIHLTAYDPVSPSASKIFVNLLKNNTNLTIRLVFLDPTGVKVEEWIYNGCKIINLGFSPVDWGQNMDPINIHICLSVVSSNIV